MVSSHASERVSELQGPYEEWPKKEAKEGPELSLGDVDGERSLVFAASEEFRSIFPSHLSAKWLLGKAQFRITNSQSSFERSRQTEYPDV